MRSNKLAIKNKPLTSHEKKCYSALTNETPEIETTSKTIRESNQKTGQELTEFSTFTIVLLLVDVLREQVEDRHKTHGLKLP